MTEKEISSFLDSFLGLKKGNKLPSKAEENWQDAQFIGKITKDIVLPIAFKTVGRNVSIPLALFNNISTKIIDEKIKQDDIETLQE